MQRAVVVLVMALSACGPRVDPSSPTTYDLDTDDSTRATGTETATPTEVPATPITRTGTVERSALVAVLDAGPSAFLRNIDVRERLEGERFIGWELVSVAPSASALRSVDLAPGDLLLAVNGRGLPRPDALFALWGELRTAEEIVVQLDRAGTPVELRFEVVNGTSDQAP